MNKKTLKTLVILLIAAAVLLAAVCTAASMRKNAPQQCKATFLGVKGYGTLKRAEALDPDSAIYRFRVGEDEKCCRLDCGTIYAEQTTDAEKAEDKDYYQVLPAEQGAYPIQNLLHEGDTYRLIVKDGTVTSCEALTQHGTFTPIVSGTPGKRTLKNLLQTGLMPMGNVLYVYGGGWDWQDVGSSAQARSIGVSELWTSAFANADAGYSYKDDAHPSETTYPLGGWNQYYDRGLDCSAYVGWTLYNTLYDESLTSPGFVRPACDIARSLADDYGLGTWSHTETELRPGDVVSLSGHVWICLGCCADGSAVAMESNVETSYTNAVGGGVRLCALSPKAENDRTCDAYGLVSYYMKEYYPQWAERYPDKTFSLANFTSFSDKTASTGVFHWNLTDGQNGLADPEGLAEMDAAAILQELFRDAVLVKSK